MAKIAVYHFHNGSCGGVLSVIRNLLRYRQHSEIENHVIYTINRDQTPTFLIPGLEEATSEKVFYYSPKWNFYYTCSQLAKLLPDDKAVVVAHDWLELGMVSNLGLQNPVVQVLHGDYDYYYNLALLHTKSIDLTICVSKSIFKKLENLVSHNVCFQYVPVPPINCKKHLYHNPVQLIFAGRCEEAKGYYLLPEIEANLRLLEIPTKWLIAGSASDQKETQSVWPLNTRISFSGEISQSELFSSFQQADIFILPSLAEGLPVSVIEAMKAGVIPLVNKEAGGVSEIITHGENGFLICENSPYRYAELIRELINDRISADSIAIKASEFANIHFNPNTNTNAYEEFIVYAAANSKFKQKEKPYGSRLDRFWIPNIVTNAIRYL